MNALLAVLALALCAVVIMMAPDLPYGASAILVCAALAIPAGLIISRSKTDRVFLLRLFIGALLVRMFVGTMIFHFNLQDFFGGDALTYDFFGYAQLKALQGEQYYASLVKMFVGVGDASAWGMLYLVAIVYGTIGRNMLAVQFVNAVVGAATAPLIFLCAQHIFRNIRVARIAGFFVAFFPSLVLWSSQGLKDGPIVFLLAIAMLATLKLGEKFNVKHLVILAGALFGLLSMRFYIFYIAMAAIVISFAIGMRAITAQSLARQVMVIVGLVVSLTFLGITRFASVQLEQYTDLSRIQVSRADASRSAQSGFAQDVDVSSVSGALSALPIGTVYLLFAPFPWQLASLRQSITLPEMVIWWLSFPALILGLWFAIKYRFRKVLPILIFTTMLTLAYALFQGNVGTAYRQRAQIQVFYFIFVAVGYILLKERRENRRIMSKLK